MTLLRDLALVFAVFACVVCLVLALVGCRSPERTQDDFPQEIANDCHAARASAIRWFEGRYHFTPKIPAVMVSLEDDPIDGLHGGLCVNSHYFRIWKKQRPWMASLDHEFRHTLCKYNGVPNMNNEESVK